MSVDSTRVMTATMTLLMIPGNDALGGEEEAHGFKGEGDEGQNPLGIGPHGFRAW